MTRAAFTGLRLEFLIGELKQYSASVADGTKNETVKDIVRRYFKRFPPDLDHSTEPTEAHLSAVDDALPDPEPEYPDPADMLQEHFKDAVEAFKKRQTDITFRTAQIERWFSYRHSKENSSTSASTLPTDETDPMFLLTCRLLGKSTKRPRKPIAYNLWGRENKGAVKHAYTIAASKGSGQHDIGAETKVKQDLYAKQPDTVKKQYEKMAERTHKGMLREWNLNLSRPASTDPESRQVCIDGIASFMQPVLDLVVEFTGMPVTFLMGGPEPAAKGRMNIIALHSGVTKGPVKMNFGEAEREGFHLKVVPVFSDFLRKCFTREDGKAAVLPVESVPLLSILDPKEVTYCAASGENFGPSPEPSPAPSDPPARGEPKKALKKPVKDARRGGNRDSAPKKKSRFDDESQSEEEAVGGGADDSDDEALGSAFNSSTHGASHEPSQESASEVDVPKKSSKKSSSRRQVAAQKRPTGRGGKGKGKKKQVDEESQTEEADAGAADSDDEALANLPGASRRDAPRASSQGSSSKAYSNSIPPPTSPTATNGSSTLSNARGVTSPPPAHPSPAWTAGSRPSPPASSPPPPRSAPAGREASVMASKPQEHEVDVDARARSSSPMPHTASKARHAVAVGAESSSAQASAASKPAASPTDDDAKLGRGDGGRSSKRKGDGALEAENTKRRKESGGGSGGHDGKRKADDTASAQSTKRHKPSPSESAPAPPSPPRATSSKRKQAGTTSRSASRSASLATPALSVSSAGAPPPPPAQATSSNRRGAGAASRPTKSASVSTPASSVSSASAPPTAQSMPKLPDDANAAIKLTLELAKAGDWGQGWEGMLAAWLRFEEAHGFNGTSRLGAAHRPASISEWIQRARSPGYRPQFDTKEFQTDFWKWWIALQPGWRRIKAGTTSRDITGDWGTLDKPGANGLASVVAALFFWGYGLGERRKASSSWTSAVDDVSFLQISWPCSNTIFSEAPPAAAISALLLLSLSSPLLAAAGLCVVAVVALAPARYCSFASLIALASHRPCSPSPMPAVVHAHHRLCSPSPSPVITHARPCPCPCPSSPALVIARTRHHLRSPSPVLAHPHHLSLPLLAIARARYPRRSSSPLLIIALALARHHRHLSSTLFITAFNVP
ncbi:hypothetical protein GALMADRAFT_144381 [Galerina marginata CBS 339.88]|uniref:Uncharacterized protein n=1 Tax=Galerina marginata (strain CBS 339.88) TaxID=685588 RepID=A0A067SJ37_GALM3|nr:hypothetical protein GALMADRAFT_144381 [Galerina marginata CBS 339.88]